MGACLFRTGSKGLNSPWTPPGDLASASDALTFRTEAIRFANEASYNSIIFQAFGSWLMLRRSKNRHKLT